MIVSPSFGRYGSDWRDNCRHDRDKLRFVTVIGGREHSSAYLAGKTVRMWAVVDYSVLALIGSKSASLFLSISFATPRSEIRYVCLQSLGIIQFVVFLKIKTGKKNSHKSK